MRGKNKMTEKEFLEKYGEVEVMFESYYKFTFNFGGLTNEGANLTVYVGGDYDQIYGLSVQPDHYYKVKDLPYVIGFRDDDFEDGKYQDIK